MIVQAEISEDGLIKVSDPEWRGKKIALTLPDEDNLAFAQETDWEAIKKIVRKAKALDFPRRTPEEIIRDLHELRG